MSFNERLKEARIASGLTQKQLAEKLGIAGTTVTGYEKGNSEPNVNTIGKIMDILQVDANFLWQDEMNAMGGFQLNLQYNELEHIKKYRALDAHGQEIVNFVIDIEAKRMKAELAEPKRKGEVIVLDFSSYKASAGTGNLLLDGETTKISVYSNNTTRKADMCISVTGDSMVPKYDDGDILLVRRQPAIETGEIGIFLRDNEAFVKKKGAGKLISLNDKYPDVVDRGDDIITCYGKVIDKLHDEWKVKNLDYPDFEPRQTSLKAAQESVEYTKE